MHRSVDVSAVTWFSMLPERFAAMTWNGFYSLEFNWNWGILC